MPINDFREDLNYSNDPDDNKLFDNLYKKLFPNIKTIKFVTELNQQKQGYDKIITLGSGKQVLIEEKKRRDDYSDILLELWSDFERKKRGWLYTTKSDYIIYAVMPSLRVYILPTILLKLTWNNNKELWINLYREITAQNDGYITKSIAIPPDILFGAMITELSQFFGVAK